MTEKKYNNMVGLILYSGNPFAIKKIHDIVEFDSADSVRREIIETKYAFSRMNEAQRTVYRRIAEGDFVIGRRSASSTERPLDYTTQIEYYHDMMNIHRREVQVPVNSNVKSWFVIDEENNIAFRCDLTSIQIEPNRIGYGEIKIAPVKFSTDIPISKLFYYLCSSIDYKNNECNKIEEVQAAYEFQDKIANLYKR